MRGLLVLGVALALVAACDDDGGGSTAADGGAGADGSAGTGGAPPGGGSSGSGGTITDGSPSGDAASLPAEGLFIDGLTAAVTVRFDSTGVLHVGCAADEDCIAAQGYYHAAHRFIQMDINRRYPRGRLGELAGQATLETDKRRRSAIATRDGGRIEEQLLAGCDDRTRALLEAYARGVNAWIRDLREGRNGARLNDEYDFPIIHKEAVADWTPQDSLAAALLFSDQLTNSAPFELGGGETLAKLTAEQAHDFYSLAPSFPSAVLPTAQQDRKAGVRLAVEKIAAIQRRLRPAARAMAMARERLGPARERDVGSNNWVVGPALTTAGAPLLSNDPHLDFSNPSVWYLVELDSKSRGGGLHVAGVSSPGLPGVVIGQNEDIAWGATTTYFDQADVYIETLSPDGEGVMFHGEKVPFVQREETFTIAGGEPVTETFQYVPHHGPVLSIDREAGTAVTFRWAAQDGDTDANVLLAIAGARSVEEARDAFRNVTALGQNWVAVDRAGHIGWFPYNRVPKRPWASPELAPWLPLPGDGSAEWDGYLDYADLPQALDPPAAFIATANNDQTGALADGDPTNDDVPAMQAYPADGYRHGRIAQRIVADAGHHDLASMRSIVGDVHSLLGETLAPALLDALGDEGELSTAGAAARDALAAWDFECPTGLTGDDPMSDPDSDATRAASSIGCTVFHALVPRVAKAVFGDELDAAGLEGYLPFRNALVNLFVRPEMLAAPDAYWDDVSTEDQVETRAEILRAAFDAAGESLADALGDDPQGWRWGRIHLLTLRANLFSAAGITMFDNGAYAAPGGAETVNVGEPWNPLANDYSDHHGASTRLNCEAPAATPVHCTFELPGGQRHHRDDPHYADLLPGWLRNEPIPLPFTADEVMAATAETLEIQPTP